MTKQQAVEIRVEFICPVKWKPRRYAADMGTFANAIGKALGPDVAFELRADEKLPHCWILTIYSLDLDLSGRDVRNAMSSIKACWIEKVRLRAYNLPILKHERKRAKQRPSCKCKKLFCKHIPKWASDDEDLAELCKLMPHWKSEEEALAVFEGEDRRYTRRREQRNRVNPVFPYGKGLRKPRVK